MVKKMRPSQVVFGIAVLVVLLSGIYVFSPHHHDNAAYKAASAAFGPKIDAELSKAARRLSAWDFQGAEAANGRAIEQVFNLLDATSKKFHREIIQSSQQDAATMRGDSIKRARMYCTTQIEIDKQTAAANRNYDTFISAINEHP